MTRNSNKKCYDCGFYTRSTNKNNRCENCAEEKQAEQEDKCGFCAEMVTNQHKGVKCDGCKLWIHTKCGKISKRLYQTLEEEDDQLWFCKECKPKIINISEEARILRNENRILSEEVREREEQIRWLKQKIQGSGRDRDNGEEGDNREEIVRKAVTEVLARLDNRGVKQGERAETVPGRYREPRESRQPRLDQRQGSGEKEPTRGEAMQGEEHRKKNLIMFNLPESKKDDHSERKTEDLVRCEEVIKESVGVQDLYIEEVFRLGRFEPGKTRGLLIKLKDQRTKWAVIGKSKRLKDSSNEMRKNIIIVPDLTREEQVENKKLREELREKREQGGKWIIKRGKVIQIAERTYEASGTVGEEVDTVPVGPVTVETIATVEEVTVGTTTSVEERESTGITE